MTFFHKPLMSKLSRFWRECPEFALPVLFFGVMWIHGSMIWLTDDEAYYWVLAQKPSLGYAYHPPAVAWLIALSESIFGGRSPSSVRLPGVACMAMTLSLGLQWLKRVGVSSEKLLSCGMILLSFAGIFSLSWMMVPDLPLFLGWTLTFISVWDLCFAMRVRIWTYLGVSFGIALALLSKYSAVLALGSAGLSLLFWAKGMRRSYGILALLAGASFGVFPTLLWNAAHEWSSILWQIRDRHQGDSTLSWIRYFRYWAVELLAGGVILVPFTFWIVGRSLYSFKNKNQKSDFVPTYLYVTTWLLPAALIFCLQPLMADFKPHWSFIVWWPAALLMARNFEAKSSWFKKIQLFHGWTLGVVVLLSCHIPLGGFLSSGIRNDPRLDVTNDLYGWRELPHFLKSLEGSLDDSKVPVIGSRYQTASQAAFTFGGEKQVTMFPTDLKSKDEWPDLKITEENDLERLRLKVPVLYVADNRYDAPPQLKGATCQRIGKLEKQRWSYPAKWIEVWKCDPDHS